MSTTVTYLALKAGQQMIVVVIIVHSLSLYMFAVLLYFMVFTPFREI